MIELVCWQYFENHHQEHIIIIIKREGRVSHLYHIPTKSNYSQVLGNTEVCVSQYTWLSNHPKLRNQIYNFEVLRPNQLMSYSTLLSNFTSPYIAVVICMVFLAGLHNKHKHKCVTLPYTLLVLS